MSLTLGELNNCTKCHASYSKYDVKNETHTSKYAELWCEIPVSRLNEEGNLEIKPHKGLCQFCNPESKYFNK